VWAKTREKNSRRFRIRLERKSEDNQIRLRDLVVVISARPGPLFVTIPIKVVVI
jgi:hypothetical protein